MFTGIIETKGVIEEVISSGSNKSFWVKSSISKKLKADQSVAHNGVCLTVEKTKGNYHLVTAIEETLLKTNLGDWKPGSIINLERCLKLNDRLDGHFVQGHVDTTASCIERRENDGSWEFKFQFSEKFAPLIIEKGSIAINGISLTAFNITSTTLEVAIIPYTFKHTSMNCLAPGDNVNLEFDMVGKYIMRKLNLNNNTISTEISN